MLPVLIQIGSFRLHSFGVLVALGFIVAMAYSKREAIARGYDPVPILDLNIWLMVTGLLGARLLFVAVNWQDFLAHPMEILYIWKGGLVWYGGLVLAYVSGLRFLQKRNMPMWSVMDLMAPATMLGLAVGRIGCWAVGDDHGRLVVDALGALGAQLQEAGLLFDAEGLVTATARQQIFAQVNTWPWWTTVLSSGSLVQPDLRDLPLYPTQILMSLYCFGIFVVLRLWQVRQQFTGQIASGMLVLYAICRFLLEYLRGDRGRGYLVEGWLTTSQSISLVMVATGLALYWYLQQRTSKA